MKLKEWALSPLGWSSGKETNIDLSTIDQSSSNKRTYYKEMWVPEELSRKDQQRGIKPFEQKYVISFSPVYKNYQSKIREGQINRALKNVNQPSRMKKKGPNDPNRFIKSTHTTEDGEIASQDHFTIDEEAIQEEAQYDGFYAVSTNLEDSAEEIVKINHGRWEIESLFRELKTNFEARPVYVQLDNHIEAHFLVCFLALLIFRILKQKLKKHHLSAQYTTEEILDTLRVMSLLEVEGEGYMPAYTRTDLTDDLHDIFGFRTDYVFISQKKMKRILKQVKNAK